jgi:phage tail-like protein
MAEKQSTRQAIGADPSINLRWTVEIDGLIVASFSECSGINLETEIYEHREGGLNQYTRKIPGATKHTNLVLKRGLCQDQNLWKWYQQVVNLGVERRDIRKNIHIRVYDYGYNATKWGWSLIRAFPVKWVGPEFRADTASINIETLELAYEGYTLASSQ